MAARTTLWNLDGRPGVVRSGSADLQYPSDHFAEPLSSVCKSGFTDNGTVAVANTDLMGNGSPVYAHEEFKIGMLHDKVIPPCYEIGSAVIVSCSSTGALWHGLSTGNKITVFGRGACPL